MTAESLRLDKWLWYARFFKSRALATALCKKGRIRINKTVVDKPHFQIHPGDVLTFPQARVVRVVQVLALGTRRGPAREALGLYEDLSPPPAATARAKTLQPAITRPRGAGRPTKKDRRAVDRLRSDA